MMIFVLKTMDFIPKMMDFVIARAMETTVFLLKMMIYTNSDDLH